MGLLDGKGNPRPSYIAYGKLIESLGQKPTYLGYVLLNDKDYGFVFQGATGTVLSTWAPKGRADHVDFGQSVQIVDPVKDTISNANTYELTVAPILVLGVPDTILKQAKANKDKPLPMGRRLYKCKIGFHNHGRKEC